MAEEPARIIIEAISADKSKRVTTHDLDTDIFSMGTKVPVGVNAEGLQSYVPLSNAVIDEGSSLQITAAGKNAVGDIVESEESSLRIEGIMRHKASGRTFRRILTFEDFVGFQPSAEVNVTLANASAGLENAVKLTTLGFVIPAGHDFTLTTTKTHVFLGDDT